VVTFVASTNWVVGMVTNTITLQTNTVTLTNVSGAIFAYVLTGVPANVNGLSAKTAWNLRRKLPVALDNNNQAVVNFTTTSYFLLGGDITGDNLVNTPDYGLIRFHFGLTNYPLGDINGDGIINTLDYGLLRLEFGKRGDSQ
jgi:hypothetical protein